MCFSSFCCFLSLHFLLINIEMNCFCVNLKYAFLFLQSSILHSQPKSTVGTPAYIAPGILLRQEYDGKDLNLSPECRHLISRILVADPATFQEPEQPMQSLDNIMQIISEATIPDVRSLYGFLLNLRLMLIVAEK
ncbi:hypothetical protein HID58_035097 [Brassica napus]|uniref:Protein kinase domain-containing protein n=1 Tax=Brassica napus TaxID=3708 RepID=A0ABQ8C3Y0_BRANA|nr:hypothetical protein HID58_035097 [Brassica napus]